MTPQEYSKQINAAVEQLKLEIENANATEKNPDSLHQKLAQLQEEFDDKLAAIQRQFKPPHKKPAPPPLKLSEFRAEPLINTPRIDAPSASEESARRGLLSDLFGSWWAKSKGGKETLDNLFGATDFEWSPDGKRIAVVSNMLRTVKIYDTETRKLLTKFDDMMGGASSIAFKSNSEIIVGPKGILNGAVIWNIDTEKVIPLAGPAPEPRDIKDNMFYDLSFDFLSQRLVGLSYTDDENATFQMIVYDLAQEKIPPLKKLALSGLKLAIAPGGKRIAFRARKGQPAIADIESGKVIRRIGIGQDWTYLEAISWSPNGALLATGTVGRREYPKTALEVWDAETGKKISEGLDERAAIKTIDFSPEGKLLAVSLSPDVHIYDVQNLSKVLVKFTEKERQSVVARFSPNGKRIGRLLISSGKLILENVAIKEN